MQTDNRAPAFDQNRKIFIGIIIAVILLIIIVISFLQFGPKLNKNKVAGVNKQATATVVVLPTATTAVSAVSAIPTATAAPVTPTNTPVVVVNQAAFQPPARPTTYTLQKGEFPYCIARRYDLDLKSFLALNHLTINSVTAPGLKLQSPSTGTWNTAYGPRALRKHPAQHTVKNGETLVNIACYYGDVYPEAILNANSLSGADKITAGKTLNIP